MLPETFTLKDDFPPATYEQWRALVEADLKGAPFEQKLVSRSYEGIDVQPLYSRRDQLDQRDDLGLPGSPPFVRSSRPIGSGCWRDGICARSTPIPIWRLQTAPFSTTCKAA